MGKGRVAVLVGVGQAVVRGEAVLAERASPVELATRAARAALGDCGAEGVAAAIDVVAAVRTFADTSPAMRHGFGGSSNMPRSVAKRIGADPAKAIYATAGGQSPQRLVNELARAIEEGAYRCALIVGAEAIGLVKQAARAGLDLDWNEDPGGDLEDRGPGGRLLAKAEVAHGLMGAPPAYALIEHAQRAASAETRAERNVRMADLFASFSNVAASNVYAQFPKAVSSARLQDSSGDNYLICDPYTRWLIAQDAVNQGAAAILMSADAARALGVPEEKWVYLHAAADADDGFLSERPDLARSSALTGALRGVLEAADVRADDIGHFDIYSCFPCAVLAAVEALDLAADDQRGFTLTGGLPYFGGAGNNYSLHAIAEMAVRLRKARGDFGLVSANGGILTKHSVGLYSTTPTREPIAYIGLSASTEKRELAERPAGKGRVRTFTMAYVKGVPTRATIIGDLEDGQRFIAASVAPETLSTITAEDPLSRRVSLSHTDDATTFTFD